MMRATIIGLVITFILTFFPTAFAFVVSGIILGNAVAAGIVSLFVGSATFVTAWVLINKKNGLKF